MANVFAITPVSDKLKAENGSATTVFTVTNKTSRPIRGIVKIKPLGNTESSWIKIDGETERDFPAGGTHQFTVSFNKPKPSAPPATPLLAESFPFRLDVYSAHNTEDFTEGQIVTVEIPEQKGENPKPFPWWILIVAAVVLLAIGGVVLWLVFRNTDVEVPDVTTKTFTEAEKELKEKGFTVEKAEEIAPDKTLDTVFKQDPDGRTKVAPESKIKLSVPAVTTVPPLAGNCLVQALDELTKRHLIPGVISGNRDRIATCDRKVGSSDPPANAPIAQGRSVNLSFPCNSQVELCLKIPIKEIVADPKFGIKSEILRRMVAPTP